MILPTMILPPPGPVGVVGWAEGRRGQEYGWQDQLPEDHVQYVLPGMVEVILMSPDFQWK